VATSLSTSFKVSLFGSHSLCCTPSCICCCSVLTTDAAMLPATATSTLQVLQDGERKLLPLPVHGRMCRPAGCYLADQQSVKLASLCCGTWMLPSCGRVPDRASGSASPAAASLKKVRKHDWITAVSAHAQLAVCAC
jgi:hypothetical protein